jgi:hypothetical protein
MEKESSRRGILSSLMAPYLQWLCSRNRHLCDSLSDCTGTAIIHYPDRSWIDLELVITNHGREFRTAVSALTMAGNPVPVNIGSNGMRVGDEDGD